MKKKISLLFSLLALPLIAKGLSFVASVEGVSYYLDDESPKGACASVVAFSDKSLVEVKIPEYVDVNGQSYRVNKLDNTYGGENIESLVLPNSLETISDRAAQYKLTKLRGITIPSSVTYLGANAFSGCSALEWVEINANIVEMGFYAFGSCSSLTSVTLPASLQKIGMGAFSKCESLTSVIIPNSVETISELAFSGCSKLSKVILGKSVRRILPEAFRECSLNELYVLAPNPPSISERSTNYVNGSVFDGDAFKNATVYVPVDSKEDYRADANWDIFKNIVESDFKDLPPEITGIVSVTGRNSGESRYYSFSGQKLAASRKGLVIVRTPDGLTKKVIERR